MALLSFIIGAALCWLVDYAIWQRRLQAQKQVENDLQTELGMAREENQSLTEKLDACQRALEKKEQELKAAGDKTAEAESQVEALQAQLTEAREKAAAAEKKGEGLASKLAASEEALEAKTAEVTRAEEKAGTVEAELEKLRAELAKVTASPAPGEADAPGETDDLQKIEGIGPKIAQLLAEKGIDTFAQLAETEAETLADMLAAGGGAFKLADPKSWPKQARLAADGQWEALKALQDELDGGKEK
jgi:predicted flap endonuclease-1-like 5' DNA nuclease